MPREPCAPPWKGPSAPPTPPAPGTGRAAYDACEAATVLFLRKFGQAMLAQGRSPAAVLPMLAKIAGLLPTHTRRSEESAGASAVLDADPAWLRRQHRRGDHAADVVLEPSAGTGLLAILAETRRRPRSSSTSWPRRRAGLLGRLFPGIAVTRFDAAQIDDHLDAGVGRASC